MTMNDFFLILLPSLGITAVMMTVSFFYWLKGRTTGIELTIELFNVHEPEAVERLDKKLKEKLNV